MSWNDVVGLGRFELPTSILIRVRSNQLSYRPIRSHRKVRRINPIDEDLCEHLLGRPAALACDQPQDLFLGVCEPQLPNHVGDRSRSWRSGGNHLLWCDGR